jgi:polyhydroxyalkanoate synthesis regulator phasin
VVNAFDDKEEPAMQRRHKVIAAAGVVGLAGLGGAVAVAPTLTAAAVSAVSSAATDRAEIIANALAGLVEDGTLTQEQADRVAETLDEQLPAHGPGDLGGPRGHGGILLELDAAADELGLTVNELHEQLHDGASLAEIAEQQGTDVDDLVSALVNAAEEDLAAAVDDGRIDQERADEIAADLEERIRTFVEEGFPAPPEGIRPEPWGGPGGPRLWTERDGPSQDAEPTTTSAV